MWSCVKCEDLAFLDKTLTFSTGQKSYFNLLRSIRMCKLAIYTQASWLCSSPGFSSLQLSFDPNVRPGEETRSTQGQFITPSWKQSPAHPCESCSVVLWSQNSSTAHLWTYLDHRPSMLTSGLAQFRLKFWQWTESCREGCDAQMTLSLLLQLFRCMYDVSAVPCNASEKKGCHACRKLECGQ